jgi:hypothetical protein
VRSMSRWISGFGSMAVALLLLTALSGCGSQDYSGYQGSWTGTDYMGGRITCVIAKGADGWSAKTTHQVVAPYATTWTSPTTSRLVADDGKLFPPDRDFWFRLDGGELLYEYSQTVGLTDSHTVAQYQKQ